jgi:hypothetical protein
MPSETITVLEWARDYAEFNEVARTFWGKLCEAVRLPTSATAEKVLDESSGVASPSW